MMTRVMLLLGWWRCTGQYDIFQERTVVPNYDFRFDLISGRRLREDASVLYLVRHRHCAHESGNGVAVDRDRLSGFVHGHDTTGQRVALDARIVGLGRNL